MEESLKFNSQVCTDINQSKRLLELGLKPETADMSLTVVCGSVIAQWVGELNNLGNIKVNGIDIPNEDVEQIPAWGLHRLIEILDSPLLEFNVLSYNPYEEIISLISECIKNGYINKEYINQ